VSDFPRMLYRGGPYSDWAALGDAIRASRVELVTAGNQGEEAAHRADGFGDVDSVLAKPKKAKKDEKPPA
jgi:hypothetical protein